MTVVIKRGNVFAFLSHDNVEEEWAVRRYVADYLAFDEPNAGYLRYKGLEGKIKLFREAGGMFPAGFVPSVVRAVREDLKINIQVDDRRKRPCMPDDWADLDWLSADERYDFQAGVLDACMEKERGILWVPTGGGKTEVACALGQIYPCTWLFLVAGKDLLYNAADRFEERVGEEAGRIGDGHFTVRRFNVATFQTLAKGLEDPRVKALLANVEGLFVDECHTLPASTFYKVTMRTQKAYFRFGLSATPMARGDRKSVYAIGALGPVIYRIKPDELVRRGCIAQPTIRMVPHAQPDVGNPTFQGVYGELIVRSKSRNAKLVQIALQAQKPFLLFVKQQSHGKDLEKLLKKKGLNVEFAWGQSSTRARARAGKRLMNGELDGVVCSVIWQNGVNLPELRSVIVGTGGRSMIAAIQRIGRGTRVVPGKTSFEVWDMLDVGNKWMTRHAKERRRAYRKEWGTVDEAPLEGK